MVREIRASCSVVGGTVVDGGLDQPAEHTNHSFPPLLSTDHRARHRSSLLQESGLSRGKRGDGRRYVVAEKRFSEV